MHFLEKRLRESSPFPHTNKLGITFVSIEGGKLTLRLPYSDLIIGNPDTGVIHGGAITTLLDSCCGGAVALQFEDHSINPTLDLRIDHMTAAEANLAVIAEAEVYRLTNSIAFVRGSAYQEDCGTILANAVATFMIMETPNKRFFGDDDAH